MDDVPCTYRLSVKAIIKDAAGSILLLKDRSGDWELPGGGLEHTEAPQTGLVREVHEETNLDIVWMSDQPVAFWTIRKEVGLPTLKWFAFVAYDAKVTGTFKSDETSNEAQEANYFSVDEAKQLHLHESTKPFLMLAPN